AGAGGTVDVAGPAGRTLTGVINNDGVVTWSATGNLTFSGGAVNNHATGTFDIQTDIASSAQGSVGAFSNAGLFVKSAGTGTTTVGGLSAFTNTGTVRAQTGTLSFMVPVTSSGAGNAFDAAAGAGIDF